MYILLMASAIVIFIHSLLLVYIIQKNTELTDKLEQLSHEFVPKKKRRSKLRKRSDQRK
ncbi:hypothetical protein [Enterococcus wangshanyuanii]|uniref:Uncharacterized protein n=1 Tax=Enterococcus wangshanyuanii TaxID=2005703 RepID=A0ABQ1PB19_9ENTE|nr:hypothetical protein [Enterococcus wangshanyuanii]GGC93680.1 hypothetical protein GCM10011573_24150 [Enterococcus wangshanyuanii]